MTVSKLIFLALIITIISGSFEREYMGVVGNLCEKTPTNPIGYCYEKLPQKGFPIAYIRDNGQISVPGKLGYEDCKLSRCIPAYLTNWLIFFFIIYFLFSFIKKVKS